MVLSGPANRLARIHPITPVIATGAGSASTCAPRTKLCMHRDLAVLRGDGHDAPYRSTSAMRALYQFITSDVTRLIVR